jgi:aspartate 1-decarboxylase
MALRVFLRSKIHRAVVTEADPDYVGSISIDEDIMEAAGLAEYEQVHVAGLSGAQRVVTYVIKAPRGSGRVVMNGPAALRIAEGERVIIFSYAMLEESELPTFEPRIVLMGEGNRIDRVIRGRVFGLRNP